MIQPVLKIIALVVATITMILALYSHFGSSWVKGWEGFDGKPFEICKNVQALSSNLTIESESKKCPGIYMEYMFISFSIVTFIGSAVWLGLTYLRVGMDHYEDILRWADISYHTVGAVLLLVSGRMYLVSAEQINELIGKNQDFKARNPGFQQKKLLGGEKLAAVTFAAILIMVYGIIALKKCMNAWKNARPIVEKA